MKSDSAYAFDVRLVQNFIDVITLKLLKVTQLSSGYDVIRYLHKRYHVLLSSGTVYSLLYSLERQGLIEGEECGRRRVYKLTKQGEEFLVGACVAGRRNQAVFSSIFSEA